MTFHLKLQLESLINKISRKKYKKLALGYLS